MEIVSFCTTADSQMVTVFYEYFCLGQKALSYYLDCLMQVKLWEC